MRRDLEKIPMKPLTTVTIYARDPSDPETLDTVGVVTFESLGTAKIVLTRNEIGSILLESAEVKENSVWAEMVAEAQRTLSELHTKLGETHVATQHVLTDMYAVHKWLTG
jgi:hypothetical protein